MHRHLPSRSSEGNQKIKPGQSDDFAVAGKFCGIQVVCWYKVSLLLDRGMPKLHQFGGMYPKFVVLLFFRLPRWQITEGEKLYSCSLFLIATLSGMYLERLRELTQMD